MPIKNLGSAPDNKVEWRVSLFLLISDLVDHSIWQCPRHLGKGWWGVFTGVLCSQANIHFSLTDWFIGQLVGSVKKERTKRGEGFEQDSVWVGWWRKWSRNFLSSTERWQSQQIDGGNFSVRCTQSLHFAALYISHVWASSHSWGRRWGYWEEWLSLG